MLTLDGAPTSPVLFGGLGLLAFLALIAILKSFVRVCPTNQILVITGAKTNVGGKQYGFRIQRGGWTTVIPFIQGVERIDLGIIPINVAKKKLMVGVSGGADSLSILFFSQCYALKHKVKLYPVIIDHNLRKESSIEAKNLKFKLKKNFSINCKILRKKNIKISKNIQSSARDLRYDLFYKECSKHNIGYLLLGHHKNDMIENFFIRLLRGSGLKGLISFDKNVSDYNDIKIVRPFLSTPKKELININTSCKCSACSNMSELDLKIFIHYGKYINQSLQGRQELAGSDVNSLFRLMKNDVVENTNIEPYLLVTDNALEAMALSDYGNGKFRMSQNYEHIGEIKFVVDDLSCL